MNTQKAHDRFWEAMRARFGLRFITEFGDKPTAPWMQLLNGYTPDEIRAALELMAEQKLAHPPTLPIFEALLRKASAKSAPVGIDYMRGYWRSVIVDNCSKLLTLANVIGKPAEFEIYLIGQRFALGQPLVALLDELCDMETRNQGQRTPGIESHANQRCEAIIRSHRGGDQVAA